MEALSYILKAVLIVFLIYKIVDLIVLPIFNTINQKRKQAKQEDRVDQQSTKHAKIEAPVIAPEKAAEVIQTLARLEYFKYVEPAMEQALKQKTAEWLMQYGQLGYEEYDVVKQQYRRDYRYFGYGDAEELYEWGGFEDFFSQVRPTLKKMGVKLDQITFPQEVDVNQQVVINGVEYILYDETDASSWQQGWGVAVERFIDIINDVLQRQQQREKLYNIAAGGVIFLTPELFEYLKGVKLDELCKPQDLTER